MKLSEIENIKGVTRILGNIHEVDVTGIFYDSRKVTQDSIFVAIKGFKTDGHNFIDEVIKKNPAAIIIENEEILSEQASKSSNCVFVTVTDSRKVLAELSNIYFNNPSSKLRLIGVTGTNGKTTTTYILKTIFENVGKKTGVIGTIGNMIGDEVIDTEMTTPEAPELNNLLNKMVLSECNTVAMEVSSHSLALDRVDNLKYDVAIFTNLTNDHLDFHKTMDDYLASKKILFDNLSEESFCIYNSDDPNFEKLIKDTKANKISYGTNADSDFIISEISFDLVGTSFKLRNQSSVYEIKTSLIGSFNAYNIAAAFIAALKCGIAAENIIDGIAKTPHVPGRFEVIHFNSKKIIIDYSHTPDSLDKALTTIRQIISNDFRLFTVMGCGGDRDKTKRPIMGKIASLLSDQVIITNDNPRTENEDQIIEDIKSGILIGNYVVIKNRAEAIHYAINESPDGAVVLIAGKGHENYQIIGKDKFYFSDKEETLKVINLFKNEHAVN